TIRQHPIFDCDYRRRGVLHAAAGHRKHDGYLCARTNVGTCRVESHRLFGPRGSLLRSYGVAGYRAVWRNSRTLAGGGVYASSGDGASQHAAEPGAAGIGSAARTCGGFGRRRDRGTAAWNWRDAYARGQRVEESLTWRFL